MLMTDSWCGIIIADVSASCSIITCCCDCGGDGDDDFPEPWRDPMLNTGFMPRNVPFCGLDVHCDGDWNVAVFGLLLACVDSMVDDVFRMGTSSMLM